ncbi:hypothetical protein OSTOST_11158 [Ostertagia ostertagi]
MNVRTKGIGFIQILDTSGPHKTRCLQKLEKTIGQLDWKGFNNIVGLLSRGTIVSSAYEPSIQALIRIIDVLDEPVYCVESLKNADISQADHPLNNLATMLSQYSTKTFSKDRYQWTKCVLQYLCEAIDVSVVQQMIVLLAEMLETDNCEIDACIRAAHAVPAVVEKRLCYVAVW